MAMLPRCTILAMALALGPTATAAADPRSDYLMHCAGCHLVDANGVPPLVPSLAGPLGRIAASPAGRDYIARVPGAAQAPLSDAELARAARLGQDLEQVWTAPTTTVRDRKRLLRCLVECNAGSATGCSPERSRCPALPGVSC